jgi:hypothetical protein
MPSNQNPVYVDPETMSGDGTIENPLSSMGGGGGGVTSLNALTGDLELTSTDASVVITPSGDTIDLSVPGGGGGSPGGSAGDIQINDGAGGFGVASTGTANISGGTFSLSNMGLSVIVGSAGNIILRTNGGIQIDSNGNIIRIGTTFDSAIEIGGITSQLGFFGSAGDTQQTVTGTKVDAVAASILAALVAMNLVIDGTT